MVVETPSALIYGSDNFVAKKLGELLVSRGILVSWDDDEVGRPLYYFDFGGGEKRYEEMGEKRVKICKVGINYELKITNYELKNNLDFRQVDLHNVYGLGMGKDWFLGKALDLAARNKNLILPKYGEKFRLLAVEDATEAIMRAVIMSGTAGKTFEIAGGEITSKEVATCLIDLAKMTRTEIMEQTPPSSGHLPLTGEGGEETVFEESARVLRWKPVVKFREGIKEVVAEFVARIDEEARNKKKITNYELRITNEKKEDNFENKERFIVKAEVEEEEENDQLKITNYELNTEKEEKETEKYIEEDEVEEEEEETVGKKIEWKKVEPIKNSYELRVTSYELEKPKEITISKPTISKPQQSRSGQIPNDQAPKKIDFPWKIVGMILGSIVLITIMVYGWFLWGVVDTALSLEKPIKLLENKQINEAKKMVEKYQQKNKNLAGFWGESKLGEIIKISDEVLNVEGRICNLAESMEKINGAIFEEKTIDYKLELTNVSNNLLEIETKIGVIQARLEGVRKWVPGRWRPQIDSASNLISKNGELITKLRQMVGILPEVLGLDGKRREYLVLLQNEMELRATGGFIGSYGILSFENGRLVSFDIKDVYEADGQLQGHVEPPEEIKKYLGEAAWFLRDSNWKPSFPEATKDIQWFFEKETGRRVDGVIGIDLAVVKEMINATGEIFVPDFKEKVNKDNLYEQAEYYSESKFFPGSVQKASFLSGVGKQLFEEISKLKTGQRWTLLLGMANSLEKNDLQIVLNEPVANQVINDLGWDGEIFGGKCSTAACYADYLFVVESNLGVNKANYFLYRSMEQKIDIKETGIERILRINYENLARTTNWPGGDYKNYLRVYLPLDVQVAGVTVTTGGVPQEIALNQVKMTNMYGKRELGFLVTVPISKKVVVEIRYGSKLDQMKDKFSYLLYIQRQPGFGDTGMINLVSVPTGWQPMQVQPAASVVGGKLLFNQKLESDIKMGVEMAK